MRSLITRVQRLEQCSRINDSGLTVILVSFVQDESGKSGTLAGVELMHNHQYIERPAIEAENEFIDRVSIQHMRTPNVLVLLEKRMENEARR